MEALQEFITDLMGNSEVGKLASGPVYAADDIKAFERQWERRRTGRPPKNEPRGEREAR